MWDPTLEGKERTLLELMHPYGVGIRALRTAGKATREDLDGLVERGLAQAARDGNSYSLTERGQFAIGKHPDNARYRAA